MYKMVKVGNTGNRVLITAVCDHNTTDLLPYVHTETFN